ncbi:Radical SAM domain protein [Candidatus Magnetoovum chiemensis]|nr:Radical SAM domain protein [Candidatus Magnetoovum chiemensis]
MRNFNEIKIALSLVLDNKSGSDVLNHIEKTYNEITAFFHPQSVCFSCQSGESLSGRTKLLKAALFEDYRIGLDYLFWIYGECNITVDVVKAILDEMEYKGINIAAVSIYDGSDKTQNESSPCIIAAAMNDLRQYCDKMPQDRWFQGNNGGPNLDDAFYSNLHEFVNSSGSITITPSNADVRAGMPLYRLPKEVDFLYNAASSMPLFIQGADLNKTILNTINAIGEIRKIENIAIYGAGTVACALLPIIKDKVSLIVDKNEDLQGKDFSGFTVQSPQTLLEHAEKNIGAILITPLGREQVIIAYLKELLGEKFAAIKILCIKQDSTTAQNKNQENVSLVQEENIAIEAIVKPQPHKDIIKSSQIQKTTTRELTKRAVLYTGYPCNIRCIFCYYAHSPSKEWHPIEQCKHDALLYRKAYNNDWVDITGGEPTIYPHIIELLEYCGDINLTPTLITNLQVLAKRKKVEEFKELGVYDFLCSVHAIGNSYDFLTKKKGGWNNLLSAVENLQHCQMKWRVNCTMTEINRRQLKTIAEFAYENGARVINYINYNPFHEWESKMDIDFQSLHSSIEPYLKEALDYCDEAGLEANVRYFPFCKMKGHENKCYNFSQLSYDPHEWDFNSWYSNKTKNPSEKIPAHIMNIVDNNEDFHIYMAQHMKSQLFCQNHACHLCALRAICDGFSNQYANRFSMNETAPYDGEIIKDPKWFINKQKKVVDII